MEGIQSLHPTTEVMAEDGTGPLLGLVEVQENFPPVDEELVAPPLNPDPALLDGRGL